jgi:periplasmic protein TonB
LRYPNQALEMGLEGSVLIRFVVNGDGSVSNVEVSRGFDPSCDKEARRVVRMMPKWIPGRMSGKAVPVYFKLPITFKIKR